MVIQRRNFNLVHVSGGGGGFSHAPAIAIAPLEHVNQISSSEEEEEEESSSSNNSWNNDRSELVKEAMDMMKMAELTKF